MASLSARLEQHGLGKYARLFAEQGIDFDVLPDLTDGDLEKLGVPLGDRRRILKLAPSLAADGSAAVGPGRDAERRQLTVMFADLVDSTKLAARLDPEDMRDLIDRYQKAVADEVVRFGGYVAKPLGDGLLIYFGWPQAHEDDAPRALRAGLAAVAGVRKLATPAGAPIAARIGIATGEVVVGDFAGSGLTEEGAVVGETPNLAARLQSIAGENAIVVSEATRKLVGRQFEFTDLGEQPLKGFDKPVRAWRVDGELASESRFDAMHGGRLGKFVGREHESGLLQKRWDEARDGECQLILIAGEAGIGKSRLVSECLSMIGSEARRIAYQGSPLHSNTVLYPVIRYLRSKAGFAADDGPADRWRKLDAAIVSNSPRRRSALQAIGELMSLEAPSAGTGEGKPPDDQREATLDVLVDSVKAEAEAAPLLIVVEDAHWLDPTTQELIERLLEPLLHTRTMVLVTYRPEFVPPWAQHANVGLLSLSRLGRRDARAIVDSLIADGQSLPPEIADDIVAKGDGVPLFVEELTGAVMESARSTDDRRIQIPATLRDSLSARLDRVGSAKEVAQIAAAFGREFVLDLVAAALDRPEGELLSDIERLTSIDVIFQTSRSARRYMFRHALLQEAAYESMLKSKRREVHGRIADVLMKHRPEVAETEPEVLGAHLALSGDTVRAAECWQKAGHLASRNSAYREAIGAFKNALSLMTAQATSARADTHRAVASAYFATGDDRSTREHLERAAADAEAAGDQVMMAEIAMQRCHDLIGYGGSLAEAFRFGEQALEIATRLDDEPLAYGARFSLGHAAWYAGDFPTAIRLLTANLLENVRDPKRLRDFGTAGSLVIDSLCVLGTVHAHCGEFERALAFLDRAGSIPTVNPFDFSVVQFHLNRSLLIKGEAATVLPLLVKALRQSIEAGVKYTMPWHQALLGYARVLVGEVEDGIAMLRSTLVEAERLRISHPITITRSFLGEVLAERDPEQALEMAEAALSLTQANGYRAQEAEALRVRGMALMSRDLSEAEASVKAGSALARQLGMRPESAHSVRVLGDIAARRGDGSAARAHYAEARALFAGMGMTFWVGRTPAAERRPAAAPATGPLA